MRVWPILAAAIIALLSTRHSASQEMFVANIKLMDGATLRLNAPTFVYDESHTAPGYIIGPTVTEPHGNMDHLPVTTAFGTIFVPFHLIKAVTDARQNDKAPNDPAVTVVLTNGNSVRGTLGVGSGYNDSLYMNRPHLAGQGAFGNIEVDLRKIAELTFATTARNSRTFKSLPSQKAGGPFLVSADTATLKVETIFGAAGFDPRANAFVAAKLEVGGVSFEPDFALISRVSITSVSYGTSRAEFVNRSGEQLVGPLASPSRNGLFGESGAGLVFVSLSKPVRIERQ